ncbi:MAG: zinc-dependent metalloprotease [Salegentibacter mishustinae]|nr:zinc-dependent metalloprotease [Salegentibacter mishustinae]
MLEKAGDPCYEFGNGYGVVDPQSQRESLGDDQVKASEYGLANLKKVVPNLIEWTSKDGYAYDDLEEVYRELTYMWRGYVSHVVTNVGGVYETRKTSNQDGVVYENVPRKKQEEAVNFLVEEAFTTPDWLLNQEILNRIEASGAIERVQNLQTRALNSLLDEDRLNRMIANEEVNGDKAYTAVNLMQDLRKGIFSELYNRNKVDAYRRNLQRSYVDIASEYLKKLNAEDNEALLKSDILPLMRGEMQILKREINRRKSGVNHSLTQYHWEDLIARIDAALDVES